MNVHKAYINYLLTLDRDLYVQRHGTEYEIAVGVIPQFLEYLIREDQIDQFESSGSKLSQGERDVLQRFLKHTANHIQGA